MSVKNDVYKNKLNCQKCENIYWSLPFGKKNIWGYFVLCTQAPRRKDLRIFKRFHTTNRQNSGMQRWHCLWLFIEWFRESVAWREVYRHHLQYVYDAHCDQTGGLTAGICQWFNGINPIVDGRVEWGDSERAEITREEKSWQTTGPTGILCVHKDVNAILLVIDMYEVITEEIVMLMSSLNIRTLAGNKRVGKGTCSSARYPRCYLPADKCSIV
jgi:hypothetical protein